MIVRNYKADTEKIVIMKYPNGKYYIHLGYMEDHQIGSCVAGGYDGIDQAETMLKKFRPTAERTVS